MRLEGKVALITGGGRGIGRETTMQLAKEGAAVVINDIDPEPAQALADEISASGGKAVICPGNITHPDFPKTFIDKATSSFGDIHIIVNNAGFAWDGVIQKLSDDQFDAMIDVHVKAPWRILREASEIIRINAKHERSLGRSVCRKVVNVSSISGTRGNAGQTNYSAAKSAVVGMTRSIAKEWGRYNVTANCIAFGLIDTRLTKATDSKNEAKIGERLIPMGIPVQNVDSAVSAIPLGRAGSPREAGGAILLMCLPESDYISGQLIEVTGGQ
jgi:3-oxoacyl-[acyl-carrier protein] reductase